MEWWPWDVPAQRATRAILRQPLATGVGQIGTLMRRAGGTTSRALIPV